MTAAIFVGPTLWNDSVLARRDVMWLPPAAQGDVYRAVCRGVRLIGIVDGRFENTPAVWHKEILWALSRGVHVFGAASMGALRAAELAPFGMVGVGAVFRDFARGRLTDDDDVAVLHAPEELGYRPLTEAMVDIRATLAAAEQAGVVSARCAAAVARAGKAQFFKERTWASVLERARRDGVAKASLARLERWVPANRVEQKRRDALQLLRKLCRFARSGAAPFRPAFRFSDTVFWRALKDELDASSP